MELRHYYQTSGEDRAKIVTLLQKHFSNDNFSFSEDDWEHLSSCEFMKAMGFFEQQQPKSWISAIVINQGIGKRFVQGEFTEETLPPFNPKSGSSHGDLFWLSLIFEQKNHAPYLIRSLFKDIEKSCRKWKLNIDNVYAVAYSDISRRLMKKYKFEEVGKYEGQYSIMKASVNDNPYLKAIIPHISLESSEPWG